MTKLLLPYYLLFFGAVFVWPTWRTWRRTGINPLVLPRNDSAEGFIGLWFKAMIGAVLVLTLSLALGLEPSRLGLITWLDGMPTNWVGTALLVLTLPLVALAQSTMGRAWRIGIDSNRPTELVTHGLFAISRNPIFLALRLNLAGLFMSLPSAVTLSIWLVGELLMGVQVRLEESHLSDALAEDYRAYAERTPRWI
ncbi:isoprenylcysteine carboxylmethyltransferase family protein [Novosphingobium sp.]|uniref:methyltransferase family protein n=1 Tax=Novosphingobium sp. TaxID=1874826 RepID=UPI002631FA61|nr:isoprenylcysteine carboxylmethyltransferase family protein [Novosphingobium sp.]